ncbi:hypothetical protein R3P38DRAFT_2924595 [Favolaschia claudopus]|uniref:Uncharacterized protein n=1 Tax=Favolaschia claudopus TaxID=2862362 RepID=A0AAW0BZ63_9AGAR
MSDSVCSIACVACLDIWAGFCIDFTSLRHAFTENLCGCSCCRRCCPRSDDDEDLDHETGEREPLISGGPKPKPKLRLHTAEMPSQPPMEAQR